MLRSEFKKYVMNAVNLLEIVTLFSPTTRDDAGVRLLKRVLADPQNFNDVCVIIGLPEDAPVA